MIFQYGGLIIGVVITVIVVALIMFFVGIKVMQWYATKKGWDSTFRTAAIVNLVWLIIDIPLGLMFTFLVGEGLIYDILRIGILIVIGSFVVMNLYKQEFGDSFVFVLVVQLILFVISLIVGLVIGFLLTMILVGLLL